MRRGCDRLSTITVLAAIELDDQPCFYANEIRNKRADGILALKLEAAQSPSFYTIPKLPLRIRLIAAQSLGALTLARFGRTVRSRSACDHGAAGRPVVFAVKMTKKCPESLLETAQMVLGEQMSAAPVGRGLARVLLMSERSALPRWDV